MSHVIHENVTEQILKALAEGLIPWRRPCLGHPNDGLPTNAVTGFCFRGINILLLNLAGCRSKWWATQREWNTIGFEVKPIQQGTQVFHGDLNNLASQTVFNAEEVDGPGIERFLVSETTAKLQTDFEAAEKVIAATGADIRQVLGNEVAYYHPPLDYIILPTKEQFACGPAGVAAYYLSAFHELAHYSEHLLRWWPDPHRTIKERYAINEMRSECTAGFLASQIGIPYPEVMVMNHKKFVRAWMQVMQSDPSFIFRVAAAADDAANFILSFSQEKVQTV